MSVSILKHRQAYYQALADSKDLNITPWIEWFLKTLEEAIENAIHHIDHLLLKVRFWQRHHHTDLSEEQRKVLNRLLEGGENDFRLGISASQYQKVANVSKATATRHLNDLLHKGCIQKCPGGGRNTRYQIMMDF